MPLLVSEISGSLWEWGKVCDTRRVEGARGHHASRVRRYPVRERRMPRALTTSLAHSPNGAVLASTCWGSYCRGIATRP